MVLQEASGLVTNWLPIVASALLPWLCLLFLSLPNTVHIIFIYLFMFEDNHLLTGSGIWQQPRPVMIQVNSLFIVMHSDDERCDDQTTSGY